MKPSSSILRSAFSVCSLLLFVMAAATPLSGPSQSMTVPHTRRYFYAGGHYEDLILNGTKTGQIRTGHIYVEQLMPVNVAQAQPYPIVFWTGNGQTGTNWLNTPDGRPGWASHFLSQGYVVYLTDQPSRGRSPWDPYANDDFTIYTAEYCQSYWTATQNSTDLWPQATLHTQFPGTGLKGDSTFDAYYASQVPALTSRAKTEKLSQLALNALFDQIGPAFLITHSQGGSHGWLVADSRPGPIRGLIAIEPEGPPFVNEVIRATNDIARPYGLTINPIAYDPPVNDPVELNTVTVQSSDSNLSKCVLQIDPSRRLTNISGVPIMLVTSEAGYHAVYDYCTVEYLRQAGCSVEWLDLPTAGIHGNGHFMFMEKNNLEIAGRIESWIQSKSS